MTATVSDVLRDKGSRVVTVAPDQPAMSVVETLTKNRIGAAPVVDVGGRLVGIISERDIIRGLAQHGDAVLPLTADRLMTREVMTCSLKDPIVGLMEVMTNHRIRHLPVVENGSLRGIVSIGDVVKQRLAEAQFELEQLRSYIVQG
jgi:CBS domain-containing protein